MGAKTKLTPEVQKTITDAIQLGSTYVLAAQAGGIDYSTMAMWMRKGQRGPGEYRTFFEALKKAEGQRASRWLAVIEKAASEGEWQAAAWKLERLYPETYGRKRLEVSGPNSGPIVIMWGDDATASSD